MSKKQPPLLLTSRGLEYERQTLYSLLENRYHTPTTLLPVLQGMRVLDSVYGWLVLVGREDGNCCLWNPSTRQTIHLPTMRTPNEYNRCVLSKPPTEPDCYILFNSESKTKQWFCKLGDTEFRYEVLLEEYYNNKLLAITSFQGKIYGVVQPGCRFVTIDFDFDDRFFIMSPIFTKGEQPWRVPHPILEHHRLSKDESYFMESPCGGDDQFLLVIKMNMCEWTTDDVEFRVYRVDINQTECVELDNIGEQTIFVGYEGNGFCCSSSKTKSNSIYFTNSEGRDVYIYDLADRSISSFLPCPVAGRYRSSNYWVDLQDALSSIK